jgi:BlaI family penicillinase repressor
MPRRKTELTEAEWTIIKAVWQKEPVTTPEIQEKLHRQTGWTYSTVRTLMDRMVAKGLLTAAKLRNLTLYRSAVTRAQAQRQELLYAMKHAFNGALSPMVQFLLETNELSLKDLEEIEALVRQKKKKSRGNSVDRRSLPADRT